MSAKWTEDGWRRPDLELARPPARPSRLWIVGGILAWVGLPAGCWAAVALVALHYGWIG